MGVPVVALNVLLQFLHRYRCVPRSKPERMRDAELQCGQEQTMFLYLFCVAIIFIGINSYIMFAQYNISVISVVQLRREY